jgi:hypothetical protein
MVGGERDEREEREQVANSGGDLTNTTGAISPFDTIKHQDEGGDYWSARELAVLLGYSDWRNFMRVVAKAKEACEGSGQAVSDHFVGVTNMIELGKGARREIDDVHLSRSGRPTSPCARARMR